MKPVTSRPANSERYLVCKGYHSDTGVVLREYLKHVNLEFDVVGFGRSLQKRCIQEVVPLDILKGNCTNIWS